MGRTLLIHLYIGLSRNRLFRNYINHIRNVCEIIRPGEEADIILDTMKLFLKGFAVTFFVILFGIQIKQTGIYHYLIICALAFLLNDQMIRKSLEKEELKLLKQFETYLADVRHYYSQCSMVEEAIHDSLEDAKYEISLHINRIYELLTEKQQEVEEYKETAPNKYLTTFFALCSITIQYGDTMVDSQSLFLANLSNLKNELNLEILKRQKIQHVFQGLLVLTILPVFFLKTVEGWGMSNLPELKRYYQGEYGVIMQIVIFLVTMASYTFICKLKEYGKIYRHPHILLNKLVSLTFINNMIQVWMFYKARRVYHLHRLIKKAGETITVPEFLVQKWILFFLVFIAVISAGMQITRLIKSNLIYSASNNYGAMTVTKDEEQDKYQTAIEDLTNQYKGRNNEPGLDLEMERQLIDKHNIPGQSDRTWIIGEIKKRIAQYRNVHFKWYTVFIAILSGLVAAWLPDLILFCKSYFVKRSMEDEVMQFHSIIIMLMHIARMNVMTILKWLENFAEFFKPSIMECLDQYFYDEKEAFSNIKETETFQPFIRIIEDLETCDKVGIEKAFDELEGQRDFYMEKRKQDNEISITNRGVIGRVAAFAPLILTLGGYLIIPFILESMNQLSGYMEQLHIN